MPRPQRLIARTSAEELYDSRLTVVLGRPRPKADQPLRAPAVSLVATAIGLSAEVLETRPPTRRALTPLFEMNDSEVGRAMSSAVRLAVWSVKLPPVFTVLKRELPSAAKKRE